MSKKYLRETFFMYLIGLIFTIFLLFEVNFNIFNINGLAILSFIMFIDLYIRTAYILTYEPDKSNDNEDKK